jgi:phospholipid N-methyltransferase
MFLREFRRTFQSTGAVMPSGPALSAALARYVRGGADNPTSWGSLSNGANSGQGRRILEVGPGTGAVTGHIVRALHDGDRLDLVERNDEFAARLRARLQTDEALRGHGDRITLYHCGVEELPVEPRYDVIVSGLPLNNFPVPLVQQLLDKLTELLAAGGTLSFFEYIAVRRAKAAFGSRADRPRLREIGRVLDEFLATHEIRRDRVLANVPPAWVHHVRSNPRD